MKGARYIGVIAFGYILHCIWKTEKPVKELKLVWTILTPMLFGSVGAAIRINELTWKHLGLGLLIFIAGFSVRLIATFLVGFAEKYNMKERILITVAWMPKATV